MNTDEDDDSDMSAGTATAAGSRPSSSNGENENASISKSKNEDENENLRHSCKHCQKKFETPQGVFAHFRHCDKNLRREKKITRRGGGIPVTLVSKPDSGAGEINEQAEQGDHEKDAENPKIDSEEEELLDLDLDVLVDPSPCQPEPELSPNDVEVEIKSESLRIGQDVDVDMIENQIDHLTPVPSTSSALLLNPYPSATNMTMTISLSASAKEIIHDPIEKEIREKMKKAFHRGTNSGEYSYSSMAYNKKSAELVTSTANQRGRKGKSRMIWNSATVNVESKPTGVWNANAMKSKSARARSVLRKLTARKSAFASNLNAAKRIPKPTWKMKESSLPVVEKQINKKFSPKPNARLCQTKIRNIIQEYRNVNVTISKQDIEMAQKFQQNSKNRQKQKTKKPSKPKSIGLKSAKLFPFSCNQARCLQRYSTVELLQKHFRYEHSVESLGIRNLLKTGQCPECPKIFSHIGNARRHVKSSHFNGEGTDLRGECKNEPRYWCDWCRRGFSFLNNKQRHMKTNACKIVI